MVFLLLVLCPCQVYDSYSEAYYDAKESKRFLLVGVGTSISFPDLDVPESFVVCQLSSKAEVEGKRLLNYPGFRDLDQKPGIVIFEFDPRFEGGSRAISVLPLRHFSVRRVRTLFGLPRGTLTQRTLVWAIRVHDENPQSTVGSPGSKLMAHAERHSWVQAGQNYQHHNLPMGIAKSEIVAESWPWNKNMVDAALDIVHSWRQSSGHWGAAKRRWTYYGYDMKTNGHKWFATGVFR